MRESTVQSLQRGALGTKLFQTQGNLLRCYSAIGGSLGPYSRPSYEGIVVVGLGFALGRSHLERGYRIEDLLLTRLYTTTVPCYGSFIKQSESTIDIGEARDRQDDLHVHEISSSRLQSWRLQWRADFVHLDYYSIVCLIATTYSYQSGFSSSSGMLQSQQRHNSSWPFSSSPNQVICINILFTIHNAYVLIQQPPVLPPLIPLLSILPLFPTNFRH